MWMRCWSRNSAGGRGGLDNLKPHLSRHVAESIERAGATVLPLPPYSSDYDPIEELWSKFKGQLRRITAQDEGRLVRGSR